MSFRRGVLLRRHCLKRMVLAGWNGRKSGRGFYEYTDPQNPKPMQLDLTAACDRLITYENLLYEIKDQIAHDHLQSPEGAQRAESRTMEEFGQIALDAAEADADVRVLILTGAGEKVVYRRRRYR